jgi:aminoglycoside phosphotransferase (APT) family kinase protein
MPDTAGLLADWLRERLADRVPVESQGWDSHAEIVEGRWLDRTARRPDVAQRLEVETRLMPRLAPRLPLAVPVPVLLDTDPPRTRHPLVPGAPADPQSLTAADGEGVGAFLRALHETPAELWEDTGIARDSDRVDELDGMADRVVPMLPADLREAGRALIARCRQASYRSDLRHGDLGPDHLLVTDGRVSGVIDWTDMAVGDHALDLAWVVHGTPAPFAEALISTYEATPDELARGRDWHLLGPWWEVWHGLHHGGEEYVTSGLEGVRERLQQS